MIPIDIEVSRHQAFTHMLMKKGTSVFTNITFWKSLSLENVELLRIPLPVKNTFCMCVWFEKMKKKNFIVFMVKSL